MAKKASLGNTQAGGESPKKKKVSPRQLLATVAAIVVVLVAAILIDNSIRNPRIEDELGAINVFISEVLQVTNTIDDDDPFSIEALDIQRIGGNNYYPVVLYRLDNLDTPQQAETEVLRVYVQVSNSRVFLMKDEGRLIPYAPANEA